MIDDHALWNLPSLNLAIKEIIARLSVGLTFPSITHELKLFWEQEHETAIVWQQAIQQLDSQQVALLNGACNDVVKRAIRLF